MSSIGGAGKQNLEEIRDTIDDGITITGGGGDGAILDGVSSSIKATVLDLTSSNPVTTALVDANGDQITSFGGGTQYNEGATPSPIVGTVAFGEDPSGDVEPLQLSPGRRLRVETAAKNTDDSAYAIASDDGYPIFGLANEGVPDSVDDGDVGAVRMSLNRNLYTQIRDAAGNERGANVNANKELLVKHTDSIPVTGTFFQATQPVSGTVTASISGTPNVNISQIGGNGANAWSDSSSEGDGGIIALGVRNDAAATIVNANLDYTPFATDIAGRVGVSDLGGSITVDGTITANAGTNLNTSALALEAGNLATIAGKDFATSAKQDTINTSVNTLLKPASTLAAVTSLTQMNGAAISMGTGTRDAGTQRVTIATNDIVPASQSGTWNIGTLTSFTNQGQLVDNAAFTDGTTRLNMAGYIFDEVAGTALTENDGAAARIDSKRAVVSVIEDETTRGRRTTVTASNALKVDGSAVTQPVSGTVTANAGTGSFHTLTGLEIPVHDYISLGYTGSNLTTVVYKSGGSGGSTVATLTLAYSGSTLTSVTKT